MSKKKEPAMSEFKVGDWVKRTDKITESIYQISSIDKDLIKCNFIKNGENWRLHTTKGEIEYATPEEIAAGHRIDKPSNPRELETLDKPENHISPNCKVGMFEMDKCREEFEQWFKTTQYFCNYFTDSDLNLNHRNEYENEIINGAWLTWQHQQAKVEELQTLYTQQGINMLKMQKRVDKALELMQKPVIVGEPTNYVCARFKELEQALKGEGQ